MPDVEANFDRTRVEEVIEGFEVTGRFGYTADYAKYVNYPTSYSGTSPPFTPIREWVHRKWNDLDAGLKESAFREGMTEAEHKDAVAWVVVSAIAENGTEGVFFMERSVGEVERQAEAFASPYAGSQDPAAPFKIARDLVDAAFGRSQDMVADEATDTGNLLQSGFVEVDATNTDDEFERDGGGGDGGAGGSE